MGKTELQNNDRDGVIESRDHWPSLIIIGRR